MFRSINQTLFCYRVGASVGPLLSLSVKPEDGEAVLFEKSVSDLQANVVVGEDSITGTLKHVTGYTGFSSNVSEQTGNYLALKVEGVPDNSTTVVELVGGTKGPVTLDKDMNIVLLIKNKDTQQVKVTVTKDQESVTKTYSLTGLTLETE